MFSFLGRKKKWYQWRRPEEFNCICHIFSSLLCLNKKLQWEAFLQTMSLKGTEVFNQMENVRRDTPGRGKRMWRSLKCTRGWHRSRPEDGYMAGEQAFCWMGEEVKQKNLSWRWWDPGNGTVKFVASKGQIIKVHVLLMHLWAANSFDTHSPFRSSKNYSEVGQGRHYVYILRGENSVCKDHITFSEL